MEHVPGAAAEVRLDLQADADAVERQARVQAQEAVGKGAQKGKGEFAHSALDPPGHRRQEKGPITKSGFIVARMDRHLSGPQLARLVAIAPGARPYYRVLAQAVRSLILDGRLPVRMRVPAERHLAEALGVSRTTVTAAYDLLREQGYLESRQGAGSWTALPDAASMGTDNPWIAADDDGLLPLHAAAPPAISALPAAIAFASEHYPRYALGMGYDPVGIAPLRQAIAARYTARGLATRPEQILVTTGAQHAIHLVGKALLSPGRPDHAGVAHLSAHASTWPGCAAPGSSRRRRLRRGLAPRPAHRSPCASRPPASPT